MQRALPIAALLALVLAPGAAAANPPVGTFKIFLGDGNRVYTLGGPRFDPVPGIDVMCDREKRVLSGVVKIRCTRTYDEFDLQGTVSGPFRFRLSGIGPEKTVNAVLKLKGFVQFNSEWTFYYQRSHGSETFMDGAEEVRVPSIGETCLGDRCVPSSGGRSVPLRPGDGLWKLKLEVAEKKPGVLRGVAIARLFEARVRYAIEGAYDALSDTAALTLIGRESPEKHSISLRNVMASGGQVSGRLRYDLYGQTGSTAFDVPLKSPPIIIE